jgi:hypothetical protein
MILSPQETASLVMAAITRKVTLSHAEQALIVVEIAQGIQADREQVTQHFQSGLRGLIEPKAKTKGK